jgi:hypothetical protein
MIMENAMECRLTGETEVLGENRLKIVVVWDVAPYLSGFLMEAVLSSETSANYYQTTWHYFKESALSFQSMMR